MSAPADRFVITVVDHEAVEHSSDETLLESLERANVEVHYHCREGFCGACRSQLISGDVEYTTDPLAFIEDDEILPCCCRATSDVTLKVHR